VGVSVAACSFRGNAALAKAARGRAMRQRRATVCMAINAAPTRALSPALSQRERE
jgi:hypothetical protein